MIDRNPVVQKFYSVIAASGLGLGTNLVLFFLAAFLFAGPEGGEWVRVYFGGDGEWFLGVTAILAVCYFPLVKDLRVI